MENKVLIPLAIIVAALIIGGAVWYSRSASPDGDGPSTPTEIAIVPLSEDDHMIGNPNAPVVLIEYSDLECPFCKSYHAEVQTLMDNDAYGKAGRVAWVYRQFPIPSLHPKAPTEAYATECVAELGGNDAFWTYVARIFEVTPSNNGLDLGILPDLAEEVGVDRAAFEKCLDDGTFEKKVQDSFTDALGAGAQGTPHTVFVMKTPITDGRRQAIESAFADTQLLSRLVFSDDNLRMSLSGAVSSQVLGAIIDALAPALPIAETAE